MTAPQHVFELVLPNAAAIVLDTETTGLRGHVIQFAMIAIDVDGNEVGSYMSYWTTPIEIEQGAMRVHGIDAATLRMHGRNPVDEIVFLSRILEKARTEYGTTIVAHNAKFDTDRLKDTANYYDLACPIRRIDVFCTMESSTRRCGLKDSRGNLKYPKNTELYTCLHDGQTYVGTLHDALADARLTAASFCRGLQKGWWAL